MKRLLLLVAAIGVAFSASAKIKMAPIFADDMVIQQQSDAAIWGWATPKTEVNITMSWGCDEILVKSDKDGRWSTTIPTPSAGGPYSIYVSDGDIHTIDNVMVGEVWLCSGQSNMDMTMKGRYPGMPTEGSADYIVKAKRNRPIRMCTVERATSFTAEDECVLTWRENTNEAVAEFSAVAYFFADYLESVLDVPVGVIVSAWGGTGIQPWMTIDALQPFGSEARLKHLKDPQIAEKNPQSFGSMIYNAMIAPLVPYTVKGLLWYQGEANRFESDLYSRLLPAYVSMMREKFDNSKMPFYYVQIAPYIYSGADNFEGALLREAQSKALEQIPYAGMVSTLDIGELNNIHPRKKCEVGVRLAYNALVDNYRIKGIETSLPKYKSHTVEGDVVTVTFDAGNAEVSLVDGEIKGFEVAGADKVFYPATTVEVKPKSVVKVSSERVKSPVAVRYGFRNYTEANLHNGFGMPVDQFRTDDWAVAVER